MVKTFEMSIKTLYSCEIFSIIGNSRLIFGMEKTWMQPITLIFAKSHVKFPNFNPSIVNFCLQRNTSKFPSKK